jgi:hypothetical protein
MEFRIARERGEGLLVAHLAGMLDLHSMESCVQALLAFPGAERTDDILSDHTQLAAPITPPDLALFLDFLGTRAEDLAGRRWAIVTGTPASYGMMRALSVGADRMGLAVEVFHDMATARAWLAAPPDARP